MTGINALLTRRPVTMAIAATLFWILASGFFAYTASLILDLPLIHVLPQSSGTVSTTLLVLFIAWRLGWLRVSGIARLGSWLVWLITAALMVYTLVVYLWAFFGTSGFSITFLAHADQTARLLIRQVIVGIVEEIFFRGIILYIFIRVWGNSRRGILLSLALSALIFSSIHLLQLLGGQPLDQVLMVMFNGFFSGIWLAALVLLGGSVWPAVLLHTVGNSAAMVPTLAITNTRDPAAAALVATLFELPILVVAVWLILRTSPRPVVPNLP